ncbi:hypothetical protein HK098_002811 [Nowakowskiella sp. JEL0407]|nr:hypothetical protein HK098_002811 [Nowakowskiella sp. JEL0407]
MSSPRIFLNGSLETEIIAHFPPLPFLGLLGLPILESEFNVTFDQPFTYPPEVTIAIIPFESKVSNTTNRGFTGTVRAKRQTQYDGERGIKVTLDWVAYSREAEDALRAQVESMRQDMRQSVEYVQFSQINQMEEFYRHRMQSERNSRDIERLEGNSAEILRDIATLRDASSRSYSLRYKYQVMISYNHASAGDLAARLASRLRESGFQVWFDMDNMYGNIRDRMSQAVSNSFIVVVLATAQYSQSENCMFECDLAIERNRTLAPILLEENLPQHFMARLATNLYETALEPGMDDKLEVAYQHTLRVYTRASAIALRNS